MTNQLHPAPHSIAKHGITKIESNMPKGKRLGVDGGLLVTLFEKQCKEFALRILDRRSEESKEDSSNG